MLEKHLVTKIRRALQTRGCFVEKIHGGLYQSAGLPDLVGCKDGHFFGIEVKVPGREHTLTPRQAAALEEIRKHGGLAGVAVSIEDAQEIVDGANK